MVQKGDTYIIFLDKIRKKRTLMFSCHGIAASKRNSSIMKREMNDSTFSNE